MEPNNQQFSSDYLNSIATPAPVKTLNPLILWGLIGSVVLFVIIGFVTLSSLGGTSTGSLTSVAAKLSDLKTVSDDAQGNIQSSELRTLNSSLTLVSTNINRDLSDPLAAKKIKLKDKKNAEIKKVTANTTALSSRLEDARLNGIFDRTYARELTYYLKQLRSDMSVLYKSTSSKGLKTVLKSADDNLIPLQQSFQSFKAD